MLINVCYNNCRNYKEDTAACFDTRSVIFREFVILAKITYERTEMCKL